MPRIKNTMEIFKLLNKSNCRDCNCPTCLAFAAAVFQGKKQLHECPHLDSDIIARYGVKIERENDVRQDLEVYLADLKSRITQIDLSARAEKLGGRFSNGKLTLKVMGKDFSVDSTGKLYSDIHIHVWIARPVLNYVLDASGTNPSGQWVPLRELKNGPSCYRLFEQRCEKPLKKVADHYTDLFEDMIHLFSGKQVKKHYQADISLVLHPLPKMPMLICYWKPEDGLDSSLNLFFDNTAEENLDIQSIFSLGTGIVMMFEKIALRHGF